MVADVSDISYFYRVKTSESILDKIERFTKRAEGYPVNSVLNDIFGARVILPTSVITEVMNRLDDWKEEYGLKNWYLKDTEDYTGIHVYFKNRSNFYYPWELQIWDRMIFLEISRVTKDINEILQGNLITIIRFPFFTQ